MAVLREVAEIVDAHFDQALGESAAEDAVLEEAREEVGKDGYDLEAHTG
jgi:hypothetical protein